MLPHLILLQAEALNVGGSLPREQTTACGGFVCVTASTSGVLPTREKIRGAGFLLRLLDEHAAEARDDRPHHTYGEAVERFFKEIAAKPRTQATYRSNDRACKATFGSLSPKTINRRTLADHISARKRDGVKDATTRRDLAFLSSLFSAAIRWEGVDKNPVTAVSKRTPEEITPPDALPHTHRVRRAESRCTRVPEPMLLLAVETGGASRPDCEVHRPRTARYTSTRSRRTRPAACPWWTQQWIQWRASLTLRTDRPRPTSSARLTAAVTSIRKRRLPQP